MPIKPRPYKAVCQKCGASKIVAPKSDALPAFAICPKCKTFMEGKEKPNALDIALDMLKSTFAGKPKTPKKPRI